MKTFTGTLTEPAIRNLKQFLARVDLKGSEVPAFTNIVSQLTKFKEDDKKEPPQIVLEEKEKP